MRKPQVRLHSMMLTAQHQLQTCIMLHNRQSRSC